MANEYVLASDVVAVLKTMHQEGYCVGNNEAMLRIFEELSNLKMVEAEPVVHAHWFGNDDPQGWFDKIVYCSACKCGDSTVRSPYCRYCGAKMDERVKTGYCPICDKTITLVSQDNMWNCPDCGHHIVLHDKEVSE